MGRKRNLRAYGAWTVICVVWGTTFLANDVALASFPPFLFGGARFFVAGAVLLLVLLLSRSGSLIVPWRVGVAGVATLGMGVGVVVWAQQWLPSGLTALLVAATPFWMVVVEAVLPGGERPRVRHIAGLCLGLGGVVLIATDQPVEQFQIEYLWAIGAVVIAGLAWSVGSIYTRRQNTEGGGGQLSIAAYQMLCGGIALLVAGWLLGEQVPRGYEGHSLLAFVYLIVFGSIVAYAAYLYSLRHLPVAFVSSYMYVNPLLAMWLGWLILDERLSASIFGATLLILTGLLLMRLPSSWTAQTTGRLRVFWRRRVVPDRPDRPDRARRSIRVGARRARCLDP